MPNLNALDPSENLKLFVFGPSGAGKTCFATSFPKPMYICDFDGKLSSAVNYWRSKNPSQLDGIEYDTFAPTPGISVQQVFEQFKTKFNEHIKLGKEGKFPYKTYVIDSVTLFAEYLMKENLRLHPEIKRFVKDIPVLQDYLINSTMFKNYLAAILALPSNVVVIGHISNDKDENTGMITKKPLLSGKLADEIPIRFAEVYHAFVSSKDGETKHILQTRGDQSIVCRTQITELPKFIDSDYESILKHVKPNKDAGEKNG